MRELGFEPSIVVPEPNTWREVLSALAARVELKGKRVAVQEYGVSNHELTAGLEARGARVTIVPVYRWTLPADRAPLREALNAIAASAADVAIFTSSNQVTNVIQLAEAEGIGDAIKRGFARMAVGSIGPVCSEQIRAYGLSADFEPEHSKLGHLVKEAAARAASILASSVPARIGFKRSRRQFCSALRSISTSLSLRSPTRCLFAGCIYKPASPRISSRYMYNCRGSPLRPTGNAILASNPTGAIATNRWTVISLARSKSMTTGWS